MQYVLENPLKKDSKINKKQYTRFKSDGKPITKRKEKICLKEKLVEVVQLI